MVGAVLLGRRSCVTRRPPGRKADHPDAGTCDHQESTAGGSGQKNRADPTLAIRGLSEKPCLCARSASVGSKQMRRVVAVLVACTPHAAAAAALVAREQSVLESGAPAAAPVDDAHQPFTTVLSSVHATLFNVTRDVETVEQSGPGSGPVSQLREHTESALYEIEQVLGL